MGSISKDFSWHEFEYTAQLDLAADNVIPNDEVRENIRSLVENVLQPLRDAIGVPLIVSSGYRCKAVNERAGGVKNSQHCFDEKTELLTLDGWKRYDEIKEGDAIYSYSIEKGVIEVVPIESIIIRQHNGKMMRIKTKQHDICVTDRHRMLVRYGDNTYKRQTDKELSEKEIAYHESQKTTNNVYHIETADEVFGKRRWYLNAGLFHTDERPSNHEITFMKFLLAVITDGCIHWDADKFRGIAFCLKKDRKIDHIKKLMSELGYEYSESKRTKDDVTRFDLCTKYSKEIFNIIGEEKKIPQEFCRLDSDVQRELLYEYTFYDGHFDERDGCTCFNITTTSKHNHNVLQAMCALSGMRVTTRFRDSKEYCIHGKTGVTKPVWFMTISTKKSDARVNEDQYEWIDYEGVVWCANNRNTTLITRRNNYVSIQGNCKGEAADVYVTNQPPYFVAFHVEKLKLPYDQMILYNSFVHLSHKRDGEQRRQLLYDKSYTGQRL